MKFLQIALMAIAAALIFASPSFADSHWEGLMPKPDKVQGGWLVDDPHKGNVLFGHCEHRKGEHGKGWYCHTLLDDSVAEGGAANNNGDNFDVQEASAGGTLYAVFNPKTYKKYIKNGGNIWNVTDGGPRSDGKQALCEQVGSSNCILVEAPLHNWKRANNIAKERTGWKLQSF